MIAFQYIFEYLVFFYSLTLILTYTSLIVLSYFKMISFLSTENKHQEELFLKSPFVPGISIVAPAYNEEVTIITNVTAMMNLNYPKYEVVIVNDGSKDKTLELLIDHFELEETPFAYVEKIKTKPFKRILKSKNSLYRKLTVVDKENGGTKADATNAGVNASKYPYFLNTDVDCVLSKDALTKMIQPFLNEKKQVIAVGCTMRMSNGCLMRNGSLHRVKLPRKIIPLYQEIEYLRSYLVGKLGFSVINAVSNISGGIGLLDKSVVIAAGGYDPDSHAEDMDMTTRMAAYMINFNKPYKIVHIPHSCCWTEGPSNYKILKRQRMRWARGLMQIFLNHGKYLFRPRYKVLGMIVLPYILLFELIAPVIEAFGFIFLIYLLFTGAVNFSMAGLMLAFVYSFGITLSIITISYDRKIKIQYSSMNDYFRLIGFTLFEPILYHPLILSFSIRGYYSYITSKSFEWGNMTRQGVEDGSKKNKTQKTSVEKDLKLKSKEDNVA